MISPSQLRIGNFVLDNFYINDLRKLTEISLEDFVAISHGCNSYQPIPLTEEILIKCGFQCKPKTLSIVNKSGHCTIELSRGNFTFKHKDGKAVIKYLHQLQNLYFALTGEELKFNY